MDFDYTEFLPDMELRLLSASRCFVLKIIASGYLNLYLLERSSSYFVVEKLKSTIVLIFFLTNFQVQSCIWLIAMRILNNYYCGLDTHSLGNSKR